MPVLQGLRSLLHGAPKPDDFDRWRRSVAGTLAGDGAQRFREATPATGAPRAGTSRQPAAKVVGAVVAGTKVWSGSALPATRMCPAERNATPTPTRWRVSSETRISTPC